MLAHPSGSTEYNAYHGMVLSSLLNLTFNCSEIIYNKFEEVLITWPWQLQLQSTTIAENIY